jgi:hypothetical protein
VALETPQSLGTDNGLEREFGRREHRVEMAFLRVRGGERLRLHTDFAVLARLAPSRERGLAAV